MRIYKVTLYRNHSGYQLHYVSSKKEAKSIIAQSKRSSKKAEIDPGEYSDILLDSSIQPIEFLNNKKGILYMLNRFTPEYDNG